MTEGKETRMYRLDLGSFDEGEGVFRKLHILLRGFHHRFPAFVLVPVFLSNLSAFEFYVYAKESSVVPTESEMQIFKHLILGFYFGTEVNE